jgi:hypothetical protein
MPDKEKTANLQKRGPTIKQLVSRANPCQRAHHVYGAGSGSARSAARTAGAGRQYDDQQSLCACDQEAEVDDLDKLVKAGVAATDEDRIELLKAAGLIK